MYYGNYKKEAAPVPVRASYHPREALLARSAIFSVVCGDIGTLIPNRAVVIQCLRGGSAA
jgi:hypothetical protein